MYTSVTKCRLTELYHTTLWIHGSAMAYVLTTAVRGQAWACLYSLKGPSACLNVRYYENKENFMFNRTLTGRRRIPIFNRISENGVHTSKSELTVTVLLVYTSTVVFAPVWWLFQLLAVALCSLGSFDFFPTFSCGEKYSSKIVVLQKKCRTSKAPSGNRAASFTSCDTSTRDFFTEV